MAAQLGEPSTPLSTHVATPRKSPAIGAFLSGRRDLNSGPLVPQTSALTRLRHAPSRLDSSVGDGATSFPLDRPPATPQRHRRQTQHSRVLRVRLLSERPDQPAFLVVRPLPRVAPVELVDQIRHPL